MASPVALFRRTPGDIDKLWASLREGLRNDDVLDAPQQLEIVERHLQQGIIGGSHGRLAAEDGKLPSRQRLKTARTAR